MFLFFDFPNSTLGELAGARVGSQGKQRTGPRPCNNIKVLIQRKNMKTRQSKQCGFSIYIFDNSKSKSMVRLEKMALSGLVFARKIASMILIQNIQGLMGPLMIIMAFKPLYM